MTADKPTMAVRKGDFRRELGDVFRMSVPIVIATCCRMAMDVTDFAMISFSGDTDAQAAILPAQMVIWTYIVIGMGTVSFVSTVASQALGRGDRATCSAYAWQSLYLSLAFWILGALAWPFLPYVFSLAGHDAAIQEMECRYAAIIVWSIGPTIAAQGLSSFFNGIHRPGVTMWAALEGVVANAAVSYVLIFGEFGLPRMGIAGAAWGTVVATHYRTIRLFAVFWASPVDRVYASRSTWRFGRARTINLLRFGGPTGLQWCSDVTVWAIFTAVLVGSYFGKTHQLATNAAWQYLRMSFMPCIGIGMALTTLVGRAIGEGDDRRVVSVTRLATGLMLLYMGSLSLVFFFARGSLIAVFNQQPEVIRVGSAVMICAAVFQVFDALGIGYNSALKGAGDTLVPSTVFIVSHWLIVIGCGFAVAELKPEWGSVGPWIAASALIIILGVYLWWRWHCGAWRTIDVFKHDAVGGDEFVGQALPAEFSTAVGCELP